MIRILCILAVLGCVALLPIKAIAQTEYSSAGSDVVEQTVEEFKSADQAIFSITDSDVLSWEESKEGKYVYFKLIDEKNDELESLTSSYIGEPLTVNIDNIVVFIPEITHVLKQQDGFVLQTQESQRKEFLVMLNTDKQTKADTAIDVPIIASAPVQDEPTESDAEPVDVVPVKADEKAEDPQP